MSGPLGRDSSFGDIMAADEAERNVLAVQLAYRLSLGREPEPDMLAERARLLDAGRCFRAMFAEIATTPEALALAARGGPFALPPERLLTRDGFLALDDAGLSAFVVALAHRACLGRDPEPGELAARLAELDAGAPFRDTLAELATGPEARARAAEGRGRLGAPCSDGQFLSIVGGLFGGRGLLPAEIEAGRRLLAGGTASRTRYVMSAVDHLVSERIAAGAEPRATPHDAGRVVVMGTDRVLTRAMWDERARDLGLGGGDRSDSAGRPDRPESAAPTRGPHARPAQPHTGRFAVSMIASLYRGRRFIERFLDGITAQTLFPESELIIVDANSPEGEGEVIAEYMKVHPNIVYERVNFRIGIYEAWNRGVELARGRYLTNTNLDDQRHPESVALQAGLLDRESGVDVVYQDFLYSFDPDMAFDDVARMGFRTDLPIVCPHNLLAFNAPHNAPMWRRSLHDDLGPFDTSYRSAGDYEFWARCLSRGRTFRKINTPHVVYYQNPEGISTRPDTRGVEEGHRVLARYAPRLTSPRLLGSRAELEAGLGLSPAPDSASHGNPRGTPGGTSGSTTGPDPTHHDLVGGELLRVGAARWARAPGHDGRRAGTGGSAPSKLRLAVDGVCFQRAGTDIARIWDSLLRRLAGRGDVEVTLFDRGGAPSIPGVRLRPFPSHTVTYTAADSLLLQGFCDEVGADVFASTGRTSALTTPQVQLVDGVNGVTPDAAGLDPSARSERPARSAKELLLTLRYAGHFACTSRGARDALLRLCPELPPGRAAVTPPGVDRAVFAPGASAGLDAWRHRHGIRPDHLVLAGGDAGGAGLLAAAVRVDPAARFDIVCLDGAPDPGAVRNLPSGVGARHLHLSDRDRATAYAGAVASLHLLPGGGSPLPMAEAMACGCPVISARHEASREIAGDAAQLVSGDDPRELLRALHRVRIAAVRRGMAAAGLARAEMFDGDTMAERVHGLLCAAAAERGDASVLAFHRRWAELRTAQADVDVGLD